MRHDDAVLATSYRPIAPKRQPSLLSVIAKVNGISLFVLSLTRGNEFLGGSVRIGMWNVQSCGQRPQKSPANRWTSLASDRTNGLKIQAFRFKNRLCLRSSLLRKNFVHGFLVVAIPMNRDG